MNRTRQLAQYLVFAAIVIAAFITTWAILPAAAVQFQRFVGSVHPLLVSAGAGLVGALCLAWLQSRAEFVIFRGRETVAGIARSALLATGFGVAIILVDLLLRYPRAINAPVPLAFAFYPAIGFVAEVAFHLLPLSIVILALQPLRGRITHRVLTTIAIVLVAAAEPIFQITFSGEPFTLLSAATLVHVFAFALAQLLIFRRHDFVSMYALRLIYYLYWHIIWGTLRLEVLPW